MHLYHRIRYLDIERLKAKKCHNLQMIHDSDSSEHGWWWLHVTLVVVTRLIEAELSNVADECLNAMLLQPSSDNDWMSGLRLIICWLGPRRIVCFKWRLETFSRKLKNLAEADLLKCIWMSWLVMWDWHFNQKIIETKKAGPWREVNVVNYEFHGRQ